MFNAKFKILSFFILIALLPCSGNAQTISMLFAGDAMQHQAQLDNAYNNGIYQYNNNFEAIKDEISLADIAVINFETTLGSKPYSGYPAFCSPTEFASALKNCGFDIFLTANNHSLDRGSSGVFKTIKTLDSLKIKHLGTYNSQNERNIKHPFIIRKGNIKLGMLNYTYGTNGIVAKQGAVINYIDTTLIKRDIAFCKIKECDIIIANMHWGDEYQLIPNIHQKKLSEWLHKNGVRIVIGSHPHVVQPIIAETDSSGNIENITVFSLGNFISNMKTKMTMGSIIFKLFVTKEQDKIKITSPQYSKIFTQRPDVVKNSNFAVIPCDSTTINNINLPQKLKQDMKIFNNEIDNLFNKHNKGEIIEYFFSKKSSHSCIKQK